MTDPTGAEEDEDEDEEDDEDADDVDDEADEDVEDDTEAAAVVPPPSDPPQPLIMTVDRTMAKDVAKADRGARVMSTLHFYWHK